MIYVVSGMQRSVTSMIMGALISGGMRVFYNGLREKELRARRPNARNQSGYYEASVQETKDLNFPLQAEGMAVKLLAPWETLPRMPVHEYRVLIMKRDPREVTVSMAKMNNGALTTADFAILSEYEAYMDKGIRLAKNRRDFRGVSVADYQEVLDNPLEFFTQLRDEALWPVNPDGAAAHIKPQERTVKFDTPTTGDLSKDIQTRTMSVRDAVLSGKFAVSDEIKEAVRQGGEVALSAS